MLMSFVFLLSGTVLLAQTPAPKTIPSRPLDPPDPTTAPTADLVVKQMQSLSAMSASVDKQKSAVQSQLGLAAPQGSFFTTNWTTPAVFPLPHLIASCSPMNESELTPLIAENAKKQEVKPELIHAVIHRESAFYPCAVSDRGALGLMQLMPEVAGRFGVDALDPAENVRAGSEYLKQLLNRYKGDMKLALAAYNAGPERVDSEKKVPDIPETVAYVDSVLKDLTQSLISRR